jgi:hypothetical protein
MTGTDSPEQATRVVGENRRRWVLALGHLALNCGAVEQMTINWLAALEGNVAADRARCCKYTTRRKRVLHLIEQLSLPQEIRSNALEAWEMTVEPFRVRNIVLHGGVVKTKLKNGRSVVAFRKLRESSAKALVILFVEKVELEAENCGRAYRRLETLLRRFASVGAR